MADTRSNTELRLLGGFELRCDDVVIELPMSARRVLAFLALQDHQLERSYVAGSLWPESTDEKAAANLRTSLWRLRRPGLDVVAATSAHVALASSVVVDTRELVAIGCRWTRSDPGDVPASDLAIEPHSFCRELLPGFWDAWLVMEREKLRLTTLVVLERLAAALIRRGEADRAVFAGLAAVAADPFRETANRALIEAHLACGNRVEAARQFRRYRDLLVAELHIEPGAALADLALAEGVRVDAALTRV